MGGHNSHLPTFDSIKCQREKESEKSQTQFCSLGSALRAAVNQVLLSQTHGYKIAFEGGTLFLATNLRRKWTISFMVFANHADMVRIPAFFASNDISFN